jgi:fumarylacetoacetase
MRIFGQGVPPAFYEYPMGYNGRISSIAVSGTEVVRPHGFFKPAGEDRTNYQASAQLDFEVEMGAFISLPINGPKTVTAKEAADHIFGYVLLNDWSARDIQKHEMAPFGPFHSKSFLTSISPWVVTLDALRGSRTAPPASCSSPISPVLMCDEEDHGLFDVNLFASISRKITIKLQQ